jgi:hypothetical protein
MSSSPCNGVPGKRFPLVTAGILSFAIVGCALMQRLGANLYSENFNIAQALYAGQGFANAVGPRTGPTAWNAPLYPLIQAGLLWLGEGSRDVVTIGLAVLQVAVLVATAWLVLAIAAQTTRLGPVVAAVILTLALAYHFYYWFMFAHDCWLALLSLDLVIAGVAWFRPLASWPRACCWGLCGGVCALINPSVAAAWGVMTLVLGVEQRRWLRPGIALVCAAAVLAPWTIRNYLVFGRLMPVKANLAYELFQSQCLSEDGLIHDFRRHPNFPDSREHREYRRLGEPAYLELKWQESTAAIAGDPLGFADRVANRFLATTVWYEPFFRTYEERRPWLLWARRLAFPLPFVALVLLVLSAARGQPLTSLQWAVIGIYAVYLLPYIVISYYERYMVPLLPVKTLLVLWAAERVVFGRHATDELTNPS